jgi:Fe2+ or Zn2+ uptake regulation protein
MSQNHSRDYAKILSFYRITATPIRIETLKAIYASPSEFTTLEIAEYLRKDDPTINSNSVMSVLRLYKSRGLLVKVNNGSKREDRGRPKSRFCLSGEHILTIL